MAVRKIKGTTVYPPNPLRHRISEIAEEDGANWNYWAVKFMKLGLERYERRRLRRQEKLQPQ